MPLWAIRLAPYAGGVLLAVAAYAWAYSNGKQAERARWQAAAIVVVAAAQAKSDELQAQVNAAGVALSSMSAENERLATMAAQSRKAFYVQNPAAAGPCLHSDRLRAIQAGDDAANAAITAR